MIEGRHPALQQAYQEIPVAFYEDRPNGAVAAAAGVFIGHSVVINAIDVYQELIAQNRPAVALIGAALYGISAFADKRTTNRVFDAQQEAEQHGIVGEHMEINPYLWGIRTSDEMKKSKKGKAIEVFTTIAASVYPNVTTALMTGRLIPALSNRRVARRYERATEIAKSS